MPDEYAKIIKWTALNSVRGMKATVTLPSPASNRGSTSEAVTTRKVDGILLVLFVKDHG